MYLTAELVVTNAAAGDLCFLSLERGFREAGKDVRVPSRSSIPSRRSQCVHGRDTSLILVLSLRRILLFFLLLAGRVTWGARVYCGSSLSGTTRIIDTLSLNITTLLPIECRLLLSRITPTPPRLFGRKFVCPYSSAIIQELECRQLTDYVRHLTHDSYDDAAPL